MASSNLTNTARTAKTPRHWSAKQIKLFLTSRFRVFVVNAQAPSLQPLTLIRSWATTLWGEPALIVALLLVAFVAHGFNMFNFPAFTYNGDEGIYTGQALAVLQDGRLSPYTYWYDHAPGGWLLLAFWMAVSGGPHAFGGAIESGRVLMLLLHLAMVYLFYRVARKYGCGAAPAALATLLFSLSPLAIFYQRPVMLDNLMLFWVLSSLDLLLDGQGRLSRVALSGFCFGVALLTKETAIFLLPAMLVIAVRERREHHGRFAVGGWLLPMAMVTSWYVLYAALKGELLPVALSAQLFGNTQPHVSLIDTLIWQAGRGGGGMFNPDNQFWQFLRTDWLVRDPLLVIGGVVAVAVNLICGVWGWRLPFPRRGGGRRMGGEALPVALLGLFPLYYLARGGLVFNFYIVFAIPFFCLNIAMLTTRLCARLSFHQANLFMIVIGGLIVGYWWGSTAEPLYTARPSEAGRAAISWIRLNVPPRSMIVADDAFWPDLYAAAPGEPAFPNIHSHWKVGGDPEIGEGIFHNDWRMVDYLIMTPGLERDFASAKYLVALEALHHAHPIQRWLADGVQVELWQVDKTKDGSQRVSDR
jgi:4-amino-4-deoxy-L-arabinose transferase-like glycosyltransferase